MNILLDTCTYIWFKTAPEKLSERAIELINDKDTKFFLSSVSVWEINVKLKIGKLKAQGKVEELLELEKHTDVLKSVTFTMDDATQISKLQLHHKDPFDLMLICQAITNSFTILTPDPYIKKYKIKTIW